MSNLIKDLDQLQAANYVNVRFPFTSIQAANSPQPYAFPTTIGNGVFVPGMDLWTYFFNSCVTAILTGNSQIQHFDDPAGVILLAMDYAEEMLATYNARQDALKEDAEKKEDAPIPHPDK
jgi:hypothetical protein